MPVVFDGYVPDTKRYDLVDISKSIFMNVVLGHPTPMNGKPAFYNLGPENPLDIDLGTEANKKAVIYNLNVLFDHYGFFYEIEDLSDTAIEVRYSPEPVLEEDYESLNIEEKESYDHWWEVLREIEDLFWEYAWIIK